MEALQGPLVHRRFAKDPIFEQYYSKRNTIANVNGYDVRHTAVVRARLMTLQDRVTRGRTSVEDDTGDGGGDDGEGDQEDELYIA